MMNQLRLDLLAFLPHGFCLTWNPELVWLNLVSDLLIALAYYSIPVSLIYFVRRRRDLAFHWVFVLVASFIIACGTTHLMAIWSLWQPVYELSGVIKLLTGLISLVTAIFLYKIMPRAIALPSPEKMEAANAKLQRQIAERKEINAQIEVLQEQFRMKTIELEATHDELEDFSYSVSHDLRAPLRLINESTNALRNDEESVLGANGQRFAGVIVEAATKMEQLVADLLAFSSTTSAPIGESEFAMDELVQEAVKELANDPREQEIVWEIQPMPRVTADRGLMRQVWLNLLSNAVKYTRLVAKPRITVGCSSKEEESHFFVRDNGAGFNPREADKLFGLFQRLHRADEFEGTGVGLANVRRIVSRHNGRTWAEGETNRGATFYFSLPNRASRFSLVADSLAASAGTSLGLLVSHKAMTQ